MASKIALVGDANTGKSWSRSYIDRGEDVFLLHPSEKLSYLTDSNGKPVKRFMFQPKAAGGTIKTWQDVYDYGNKAGLFNGAVNTPAQVIKFLLNTYIKAADKQAVRKGWNREVLTGNSFMVNKDIKETALWLKFISDLMPWIKTVIIPDFTHFISATVASDEFIDRKIGGEAYQRFWELSADLLKTFILSIDDLRPDMVVVIEFHTKWDEARQRYELFVPAGNMLKEKFLPESYFDVMLFTDVASSMNAQGEEQSEYRFVTRRTSLYPQARSSDLFDTLYIPNNLKVVLDAFRAKKGIPDEAPLVEEEAVTTYVANVPPTPTAPVATAPKPAAVPQPQVAEPSGADM